MNHRLRCLALLSIGILCACLSGCASGSSSLEVMAAARDIPEGAILDYDQVMKLRIPADLATVGLLRPAELAKFVGTRLYLPVERGELLRRVQFQNPDSQERLSAIVRKRGRSLTLSVNGLGWVRPNDHVDIVATLADPRTGKLGTLTLLQNVVVLAVGSRTVASRVPAETPDPLLGQATFLLLPEEVEILTMASRVGPLIVSLRNPEDISDVDEHRPTSTDTLLGLDGKTPTAPPSPQPAPTPPPPVDPGKPH